MCYVSNFFYQFSIQAVNPLINGYARSLGTSSTFAGIIVGVMSITSMLLRPFAGNLTDKRLIVIPLFFQCSLIAEQFQPL